MLRHDHEALLHGAVDGTLTLEERDALRELLTHDADARQRFGELERLNALLASLGTAEAPPHLVADVLARVTPHAAALQPVRKFVRSIPKRGEIVNKKLIFGLAAAAAVILAVITYTSYPPATEGTEATIGAAQRAQTPQIASKDVGLGDTSAQDVLQSETWDAIMKDEDLRSTLQDAEVRRMLEDSELREALRSDLVRRYLNDASLARRMSDQALVRRINEAAAAKKLDEASLDAALRNRAFLRAMSSSHFRQMISRGAGKALAGDAMARALSDRGFAAALISGRLGRDLASLGKKVS